MITLKYYPIRFEQANSVVKHLKYNPNKSALDYIKEAGFATDAHDVICMGKCLEDLDLPLKNNSHVVITPEIKEPISFIVAAVKAVVAAVVAHPFIAAAAVLSVGYSVHSAMSARKNIPNFGTISGPSGFNSSSSGGLDDSSPTYGWDGIQSIQEVGVPVKLIYGKHRTGGNIINQYISTSGDKQYLNTLLGVCEGEIESISGIKINENPIANFQGVTTDTRLGTNGQSVISNFQDLHSVRGISSNLTKNNSVTQTTVLTDVEAFEIILLLPAGLFQVNDNGSIKSWSVTYQVEYRATGDPSWIDLGTTTISGTSRTALRRVFRKNGLAADQYDIRITRTSDDSQLSPQKTGDLQWQSLDEIRTEDLAYPNTALVAVEALATDQLSGQLQNITFIVEGRKVNIPDVLTTMGGSQVDWEDYYWDPVSDAPRLLSDDSLLYWDGTTYVDKYSANPIWCLKDLQTNTRYGLGNFLVAADLNEDELLEAAKYCEQKVPNGLGGYEKRFRMDTVIEGPVKAPDLITQLSAIFNAFAFYSSGGFSFSIDQVSEPVQVFGMGNIVEDSFTQAWKSRNEIYNVIDVQYNDEDLDYAQEQITVTDEEALNSGESIKRKSIRVFTTKKSYAIRAGRYALWTSKYINRSVSFKCGIDALACQVGDRVDVAHDVPQWAFSGRVLTGGTTTSIPLDRTVTLDPMKSYQIMIRFADDTIETKDINSAAGDHSTVTVSSAFSQSPSDYDVYSVGEINIVAKPFRVLGVRRERIGEVSLFALEYNASVIDDSEVVLPTNNYSALSFTIPAVENLSLTEKIALASDGNVEDVIDVWFNRPVFDFDNTMKQYETARIYLSDDDGDSYSYVGETAGEHFAIIGGLIDLATYKVKVVSVISPGQEASLDTAPEAEITLVGKSAPPSDVTTFKAVQYRDKLRFTWTPVTDVDVTSGGHYEIRRGNSWDTGDDEVTNLKSSEYETPNMRVGADQKYWIKAIDSSGNPSANATEATLTIESIPFQNIVQSYSEQTTWSGTKVNTTVLSGETVLRISSGQLSGTYETAVKDIGYVAPIRIGIETIIVNQAGDARYDDDANARHDDSISARFSGAELAAAASYEIKTSEDNITWTSYTPWVPGDYYCRYFQIRVTLTRSDLGVDLAMSEMDYYADLPDIDEYGSFEITNASTGFNLVYEKTYHEIPTIAFQILDGSGRIINYTVEPDLVECTVKALDLSGTSHTGNVSYHIHGV